MPIAPTGLAPTRTAFPNGVVVLAKQATTTPAVTILLAMRAGSICDPIDAPGGMYLLSRLIDRGTASRSSLEIAETLDDRAVALTIGVSRHLFTLGCTCLADDFETVLALMAEIVRAPSIPEDELAKRKIEVLTAIRQDDDNPGIRAAEALMALLYPDAHPYGRRAKGTAEVVEALSRDRLMALHNQHFTPGGLTVVVVGDVEERRATDSASEAFGRWASKPAPDTPLPPVTATAGRQRLVIPMMNKAQADIAYGFVAIARRDPTYYAAWLMNIALGQYAIGGRLGDSIRERQGMAYYVYSALDANVIEGPLTIRAGVSPANVDRAVASIDEELTTMVRDGLTQKELDESRQYLIGSMPRTLETNAGIAAFLQNAEFFDLGLDYDERLPALLGSVTLDQANAAARRLLDPARAAVVVAGPYRSGE